MKINLITHATHCYKGEWLYHGDPFVADNEQDAEELCVLGFAKRAPVYETRVLEAEPRAKRPYTRRVLTA